MASPQVRPRVAAATTIRIPIRWLPVRNPWNSPWKISHSLTKPFSGGRAAMPSVPVRVMTALRGSRWIRPPSRSMSLVPAVRSTTPASRNSRVL